MTIPAQPLRIYFAGELFSSKHLLGNLALAQALDKLSGGRYTCVLPQDLEQRDTTPQAIRDQDIRALWGCDVAVFNYDGPELDSGTVVEFILAKAADIPSVLLRTDFRSGGDQGQHQDAWNLMSSFYPRTESVLLNGIALYQEARSRGDAFQMLEVIASATIEALDRVVNLPPALPKDLAQPVYQWLARLPGLKGETTNLEIELAGLLEQKRARKLL